VGGAAVVCVCVCVGGAAGVVVFVAAAVAVGVLVGVAVAVGVGVLVGVAVAVGVLVGVAVAVGVFMAVVVDVVVSENLLQQDKHHTQKRARGRGYRASSPARWHGSWRLLHSCLEMQTNRTRFSPQDYTKTFIHIHTAARTPWAHRCITGANRGRSCPVQHATDVHYGT